MKYNVTSSKGHDKTFNTLEEAKKYSHECIIKGAKQSSIFEVKELIKKTKAEITKEYSDWIGRSEVYPLTNFDKVPEGFYNERYVVVDDE